MDIPPAAGFRFHPSDEDLINVFLKAKINDVKLPPSVPISNCDLYKAHPSHVYDISKDKWQPTKEGHLEGYFFVSPEPSTNNKRFTRVVEGQGTWEGKAKVTRFVLSGQEIGLKKQLKFDEKDPAARLSKGFKWIMHEYSIEGNMKDVLCRIIRRLDKKKNNETRDEGSSFRILNIDNQVAASQPNKYAATIPIPNLRKGQFHSNHLELAPSLACLTIPNLSEGQFNRDATNHDRKRRRMDYSSCNGCDATIPNSSEQALFHDNSTDVLQYCLPTPQWNDVGTAIIDHYYTENELFSEEELLDSMDYSSCNACDATIPNSSEKAQFHDNTTDILQYCLPTPPQCNNVGTTVIDHNDKEMFALEELLSSMDNISCDACDATIPNSSEQAQFHDNTTDVLQHCLHTPQCNNVGAAVIDQNYTDKEMFALEELLDNVNHQQEHDYLALPLACPTDNLDEIWPYISTSDEQPIWNQLSYCDAFGGVPKVAS